MKREITIIKKLPKKQIMKPGDIFVIPLGDECYGFGRLTPQKGFAEYFNLISKTILLIDDLEKVQTREFSFMIPLEPIETSQWPIIGNIPYQDFQLRPFRIGGQITCGRKVIHGFIDVTSDLRAAMPEELDTPVFGICTPGYLIEKIKSNILGFPHAHQPKK